MITLETNSWTAPLEIRITEVTFTLNPIGPNIQLVVRQFWGGCRERPVTEKSRGAFCYRSRISGLRKLSVESPRLLLATPSVLAPETS